MSSSRAASKGSKLGGLGVPEFATRGAGGRDSLSQEPRPHTRQTRLRALRASRRLGRLEGFGRSVVGGVECGVLGWRLPTRCCGLPGPRGAHPPARHARARAGSGSSRVEPDHRRQQAEQPHTPIFGVSCHIRHSVPSTTSHHQSLVKPNSELDPLSRLINRPIRPWPAQLRVAPKSRRAPDRHSKLNNT